jgi:hypothetical protein
VLRCAAVAERLPAHTILRALRDVRGLTQNAWADRRLGARRQRQAALGVATFANLQRAITQSPALTTFADHHRTRTSAASIHIGVGQLISLQAFAPTIKRHKTGQFYSAREVVVCEILLRPAGAGC